MQLPELILAVVGALGGGGILGILGFILNRQKQKFEESKQFRDELKDQASILRTQIESLKVEIKQKETELEMWRERYWKIFTESQMFAISVKAILVSHNIDPAAVLPGLNRNDNG